MRVVPFDGTFEGWRATARAEVLAGTAPNAIEWDPTDALQPSMTTGEFASFPLSASVPLRVPERFLELARRAARHGDPQRWHTLYRVLFRVIQETPSLLEHHQDADVRALVDLADGVSRDVERMHAQARFTAVEDPAEGEATADAPGERFIAFYVPDHRIVPIAAPLFVRTFGAVKWSILTPDESAHWDRRALALGPGSGRRDTPPDAEIAGWWRAYYAAVLAPGRMRPRLSRPE